ncbi:MFS transporter [Paraburkholderia sp. NMBU_R16]|uniref:MFS transporter n=1 Tax=Paraburkholderia sp. NMBU_R16 TaxID=2698676 RepID=UPI001565F2FF|nr:MFS transporter [Paraburkholderia sp. NMBU_R16]NRO98725.1 MFS transporter [Paraburkholderia sp. NMBU_R16]
MKQESDLRSIARILIAASFASCVVQLDLTIVNVALPRLAEFFSASISGLQWVVDGYTLGFAVLLLSAGTLADRFGSRRVFILGFVILGATSIAIAFSRSIVELNVFRIAQGIAAALLLPTSLTLLRKACDGNARLLARALGIWAAIGGASLAAGPVVGGMLLSVIGWRSVFLINLPICAVGLIIAYRGIPARMDEAGSRQLDLKGQLLIVLALTGLIGSAIEYRSLGWHHSLVWGGACVAVLSTCAFVWLERRIAFPMLPLKLFRNSRFSCPLVFGFLINLSFSGVLFVLSLYLQKARGYSAVHTGLAFLPLTATFIFANLAGGRIAAWVGARVVMIGGALVAGVGYASLGWLGPHSGIWQMIPGFVLIPAGMGAAVPAMTAVLLSDVDAMSAGIASAVLSTARQVGSALGVAAFGVMVGDGLSSDILNGISMVMLTSAALLLIAALTASITAPEKEEQLANARTGA